MLLLYLQVIFWYAYVQANIDGVDTFRSKFTEVAGAGAPFYPVFIEAYKVSSPQA